MKDKAKLIDTAKNCIIFFLFISAVFLFLKAVLYEPDSDLGSRISSLFSGTSDDTSAALSDTENSELETKPLYILVTGEDGSHYAIKYDNQRKEELFSKFSAALGEALGSSGELSQISTESWRTTLGGSGVFFDYLYPQPLSSIAAYLGTEISGDASNKAARRLYLGNDNDTLMLYFIDDSNSAIYSCKTASSFSAISSAIAEFSMGTAHFAFELGEDYNNLDPYFIISNESEEISKISVKNPLKSDFSDTDLLDLFGMNIHTVRLFEDSASKVYVEGAKTLRIEASGKVRFSVTDDKGISVPNNENALTITNCISACSSILGKSIGAISGDASLGLVKILNASNPDSCEIFFGYFAEGIPIVLPGSAYAADFQIRDGSISKAELYFREYTLSGDTIPVLPEKQATAIVESSGEEPVLVYDDRNDSVSATWIKG